MEEFILAGLLFHVGAAATLALVSAIAGAIDARRRNVAAGIAADTAAVIAMPIGTRSPHAVQSSAACHSEAA